MILDAVIGGVACVTSSRAYVFTCVATNLLCERSGDVVGVLTLLVGGVAQAFHDDRVVELRLQLGVEEVDGEGLEGTSGSRKGQASQRGCATDGMEMVMMRTQNLSQTRCEMTSSV